MSTIEKDDSQKHSFPQQAPESIQTQTCYEVGAISLNDGSDANQSGIWEKKPL